MIEFQDQLGLPLNYLDTRMQRNQSVKFNFKIHVDRDCSLIVEKEQLQISLKINNNNTNTDQPIVLNSFVGQVINCELTITTSSSQSLTSYYPRLRLDYQETQE